MGISKKARRKNPLFKLDTTIACRVSKITSKIYHELKEFHQYTSDSELLEELVIYYLNNVETNNKLDNLLIDYNKGLQLSEELERLSEDH